MNTGRLPRPWRPGRSRHGPGGPTANPSASMSCRARSARQSRRRPLRQRRSARRSRFSRSGIDVAESGQAPRRCRVSCGSSISLAWVPQPIQPIRNGAHPGSPRKRGRRLQVSDAGRQSRILIRCGARHCASGTPGRFVVAAERLQGDRAVIADRRRSARAAAGPIDMPGADEAAIVLVGLEVNEPVARLRGSRREGRTPPCSCGRCRASRRAAGDPTRSTSSMAWPAVLAISVSNRFSASSAEDARPRPPRSPGRVLQPGDDGLDPAPALVRRRPAPARGRRRPSGAVERPADHVGAPSRRRDVARSSSR